MNLENICQKLIQKEVINYDDVFHEFRHNPIKKMYYEHGENNPMTLRHPVIDHDLSQIVGLVYFSSIKTLIESNVMDIYIIEIEKRKNVEALIQSFFINGKQHFIYQDNMLDLIKDEPVQYALKNLNEINQNAVLARHLKSFLKNIPEIQPRNVFKIKNDYFYNHENKKLTLIDIDSFLEKINLEQKISIDNSNVNNKKIILKI
jgi:hypothetical protein